MKVKKKQVAQGYIRCDYFFVTHSIIVNSVIYKASPPSKPAIRLSKMIWDARKDDRSDARARPFIEMRSRFEKDEEKIEDEDKEGEIEIAMLLGKKVDKKKMTERKEDEFQYHFVWETRHSGEIKA